MKGGKALNIPLPSSVKLILQDCPQSDDDKAIMAKVPHLFAVDYLMYTMIATHPAIAFAMGLVSHYMSNPGRKQWDTMKGVMQYLHSSKEM